MYMQDRLLSCLVAACYPAAICKLCTMHMVGWWRWRTAVVVVHTCIVVVEGWCAGA